MKATITLDGVTYTITDSLTIEHLRDFLLVHPH
jgi:hypothetical protein